MRNKRNNNRKRKLQLDVMVYEFNMFYYIKIFNVVSYKFNKQQIHSSDIYICQNVIYGWN